MPEASSPQAPAILGAILSVMDDVRSIDKNGSMSIAGSSYRFRKADDVVNAIGDAFRDHAVMLQSRVMIADHESYETSKEVTYKGNTETKVTRWTRTVVTMQYRFTSLIDGSTLDAEGIGEGLDSGDKSSSKAMTGALKYALTQALQIAFKDMADPDNERPEMQGDEPETEAQRILRERRGGAAKTETTPERVHSGGMVDGKPVEQWQAEQLAKGYGPADQVAKSAALANDGPSVAAAKAAAEKVNQAEADAMAEQQEQPKANVNTGKDPMAAGVETLKQELGAREIDTKTETATAAKEALEAASTYLAKVAKDKLEWKSAPPAETEQMEKAFAAAQPPADLAKVNAIIVHAHKLGLLTRPFRGSSLAKHLYIVQQQVSPVPQS